MKCEKCGKFSLSLAMICEWCGYDPSKREQLTVPALAALIETYEKGSDLPTNYGLALSLLRHCEIYPKSHAGEMRVEQEEEKDA